MTAPQRRRPDRRASIAPRAPSPAELQARVERDRRLGDTLVRLGKLNEEAMARIAEIQRQSNAPFAKAASKLGLLTKEDFVTALAVQNGFLREGEGEGRLPASAVIVRRPSSREAEQFRALRTRLLTSKEAEKLNLFAIAANGSSREADHLAINMAASFAQLQKRVLIVDADLRATRLAARFGIQGGPGLKETLAGECDIRKAIRPTVIANLSLLTSGESAPNSHELLSGETLRLTFDYLRCAFDIVIVATAPFGPIADAQFVWSAASAVFVVTRRNEDRLIELKNLNAALRQVDADIIGAALAG
ncbi:MAG: polysaccharide biosynthesis tyrosine autokinase [Parvularculaceae bacterium]|nr:polysaccharide biosynthesis tyrosine autokinase [Parvularculaceae bacterium]